MHRFEGSLDGRLTLAEWERKKKGGKCPKTDVLRLLVTVRLCTLVNFLPVTATTM